MSVQYERMSKNRAPSIMGPHGRGEFTVYDADEELIATVYPKRDGDVEKNRETARRRAHRIAKMLSKPGRIGRA